MSVFRVGSNKSSVNNFPSVRPTLDLDFANSKTLDPRITFTRSSGGSYVGADGLIKYAGVNEARFDHNPVTGESLGLLIEESRSNLFEWSETFVSGWGGSGYINTDTILNPYGVLGTVYYITVDEWYRTFNANGLSTLALSFFAKRRFGGLNRDYSTIGIFQQAVGGGSLGTYYFKFDGNNPNSGQFQNIRTERYQNDWYRFSCTLVARPDYNGGVFGTVARVDLEGGAADNYFWGIQVESGAFATSYIPTIGSTRTRAADNASITGKNFSEWYRQDEGTMFASIRNQTVRSSITYDNIIALCGSNVDTDLMGVYAQTASGGGAQNKFRFLIRQGGVNTFDAGSASFPEFNGKAILAYKTDDAAATVNGITPVTDAAITLPTCVSLQICSAVGYQQKPTATIQQITYYPKRLSNAQLQALTK